MYRLFLLFCFISCISSCYNSKGLSHNISQGFVGDTIYTTFEKYDRTVVRYENIIVYKNRIRQGYYSNFPKGFFVKVEDNILHIKDVMEEDLNGQLVLGVLNLLNFKEEIPHSVFIYINQDNGDEHVFHKYSGK